MYADDTHVTYAGDNADNIQFYLNQELGNVCNRQSANKLAPNMTKVEFLTPNWEDGENYFFANKSSSSSR